jgi:predicted transposase YbfD/YdcC
MADWNDARSSRDLISTTSLCRDWGEVGQVFRVERERTSRDKHSLEVVYGWTTLAQKQCPPQRLAQLIRAHWAVENRLHWRLDATLGEDRCGVRFPPVAQMLAVLNSLVLSLMEQKVIHINHRVFSDGLPFTSLVLKIAQQLFFLAIDRNDGIALLFEGLALLFDMAKLSIAIRMAVAFDAFLVRAQGIAQGL